MPSEWVVLVHHDGGGMSAARAARGQERLTGVAALLLLLAVAVGLLGQGGYYGPVQRLVGLLVAAATLLAMVARPPDRDDARLLPVVPALALVAWALADAVLLGVPPAGGLGLALLVAGVLAVLVPVALVVLARLEGCRGRCRWCWRPPGCWPGWPRP